jgi:hypothetical protein
MLGTKISRVRVKAAPETEAAGVAGLTGRVVARISPSSTGVPVVGATPHDVALAVKFDEPRDSLWFPPELLESLGGRAGFSRV